MMETEVVFFSGEHGTPLRHKKIRALICRNVREGGKAHLDALRLELQGMIRPDAIGVWWDGACWKIAFMSQGKWQVHVLDFVEK